MALDYEIAPNIDGCPRVEEFQSVVQHQLGYDPFRPSADRRVAVQIVRKPTGFGGWIRWSDARGHWAGDRRLASQRSECSEIAANVAFAVAVQIQLLAALAPATSTPAPIAPMTAVSPTESAAQTRTPDARTTSSARPDGPAATAPALAAPSPEPTARQTRLRFSAGLGPSLALGIAPHVTALGRMYVSARLDLFSLELGLDAALPTTRRGTDGSGFLLNQFAARGAACGHVQAFAACLTAGLGRIEAAGRGVDKRRSPWGLISQVGARIAATHEFSDRYFASARVEGIVMLSPWSVSLDDSVVWTTPRVAGLFGLDFGAFF